MDETLNQIPTRLPTRQEVLEALNRIQQSLAVLMDRVSQNQIEIYRLLASHPDLLMDSLKQPPIHLSSDYIKLLDFQLSHSIPEKLSEIARLPKGYLNAVCILPDAIQQQLFTTLHQIEPYLSEEDSQKVEDVVTPKVEKKEPWTRSDILALIGIIVSVALAILGQLPQKSDTLLEQSVQQNAEIIEQNQEQIELLNKQIELQQHELEFLTESYDSIHALLSVLADPSELPDQESSDFSDDSNALSDQICPFIQKDDEPLVIIIDDGKLSDLPDYPDYKERLNKLPKAQK